MRTLKPRVAILDTRRARPSTTKELSRLSGGAWETLRMRVLKRDLSLCQCAECKATNRLRIAHEVDHVVPLWEGGSNDLSNLSAINRECHARKSETEARRR